MSSTAPMHPPSRLARRVVPYWILGDGLTSIVLASLAPVDLVTVFDEDTPQRLIEQLRPDVLVKGADYTKDQVVGADLVTSYGGEVVLAKLEEGHSTTGTIAKVGGAGGLGGGNT